MVLEQVAQRPAGGVVCDPMAQPRRAGRREHAAHNRTTAGRTMNTAAVRLPAMSLGRDFALNSVQRTRACPEWMEVALREIGLTSATARGLSR